MIKLQLLLRHPAAEPELDPALRALLESYGMTITCAGRASASASMTDANFTRLFGPPPPLSAELAEPALPVPSTLSDSISLITITPPNPAMINLHR